MIQLNLLPDIKLEFVKAQRTKRLVMTVSVLISAAAIGLLVLLFVFNLGQKHIISSNNSKITSYASILKSKPNINTILTIQNQLQNINQLHSQKPDVDRMFSTYLNSLTPGNVEINNFTIDYTTDTITLTGTADSLATINTYVDIFKNTTFSIGSSKDTTPAFSNVVLSSYGIEASSKDPNQAASFNINFTFNPTIFSITDIISLNIPSLVITRSQIPQPGDLFVTAPKSSTSSGGN